MDENMVLLYQDECHFRDSQTVHTYYMVCKREKKKIEVLGKCISTSLFGTIGAIIGKIPCTKAERVWEVMKENVLANCYHGTMDHLMDSIYQFIESIDKNPEAILSLIQRTDMSIF